SDCKRISLQRNGNWATRRSAAARPRRSSTACGQPCKSGVSSWPRAAKGCTSWSGEGRFCLPLARGDSYMADSGSPINWDSAAVVNFVRKALEEDIGPGDATSLATVPTTATGHARIIARAPLVCAGLPLVQRVFRELDPDMKIEFLAQDGDCVEKPRDLVRCT